MLEGKETLSRMTDKYLALILLLALWELSGRLGLADPTTLPSLSRTVTALFDLWKKYHLFTHIMVSMVRVLIGMVAAVVLAVPLSCLLGRLFPGAYQRLEALFRIFGLINPYCLFPVFVVIFGMGETAKISALVWVAFWPIFFSGVTGVRSVDEAVIKTAMSLNPGEWKLFCKVILPGAMPAIFNGFRIGVERSFFILIAAEMTGSAAGLGWVIHTAGHLNMAPEIYAAGVCVVLLGFMINRSLVRLSDRAFFWRPTAGTLFGGNGEDSSRGPLSLTAVGLLAAAVILALIIGLYKMAQDGRLAAALS